MDNDFTSLVELQWKWSNYTPVSSDRENACNNHKKVKKIDVFAF